MTFTSSNLLSTMKKWRATLTVAGIDYDLLDIPSRTLGTNQSRGTCTGKTKDFPTGNPGDPAVVYLHLNNEATLYFTGRLDVRPISDNPPSYEVTLIDVQSDLDKSLPTQVTWSNVSFVNAVRDMLNRAGIADTSIHSIFDPGSAFSIATVYPIIHQKGANIESIIKTLMEYGGTQLVVLPTGMIQIRDAPGWPADTSLITYAHGTVGTLDINTDDVVFPYISSRRSIAGAEGRVSAFRASGPRRPDMRIPNALFTLTGGTGKTEEQEYPYLQTDEAANAIAAREIVRRNRQATEVEVTAPLNPNILPGDSFFFRNTMLGFPDSTPALVISTSSNRAQMTMLLSVGARQAAGDTTNILPPVALFELLYEIQPISLNGIIAPYYIVQAKNKSYDPNDLEIISLEWEATVGDEEASVDPNKVSWRKDDEATKKGLDPQNPIFVFPTLEGAYITLLVESESGQGGMVTMPIAPSPSAIFTRILSYASPDGWKILYGSEGWRSFGEDCTAVPGINDKGPLLAGFQDGKLYRTQDMLETPPERLYTFGGAVRYVFVNEVDINQILVAVGKNLFRSTDGGLGWANIGSFEENINYCESSGANPNEIRVCSGNSLWFTTDPGAGFTAALTGPTDSTCRKVASAPWGHLVVWSGNGMSVTGAPGERPWEFEEGYELDWSNVPAENMPVDLASVTPMQYQEGFILAAGACSDIIRDGLYGQLSYAALIPGTTQFYKVDADRKVYFASETEEGGPNKMVLHNKAFPIAEDDTCFRIGYGQTIDPAKPPKLVLLPYGASGEADKIQMWNPNQEVWIPLTPPLTGASWLDIVISPQNPKTWIIRDNKRAFITLNEGLSWLQISTPIFVESVVASFRIVSINFTEFNSWVMCVEYQRRTAAPPGYLQVYYAKGTGANTTDSWTYGTSWVKPDPIATTSGHSVIAITNFETGVNGEVFGHAQAFDGSRGAVVNASLADRIAYVNGTTVILGAETQYRPETTITPTTRQAYAVWSNNVAKIEDYRTDSPNPIIAVGGSAVSVRLSNTDSTPYKIVVGDRMGIAVVTDLDTVPVISSVIADDMEMSGVIAGNKRRSAGAMTTTADLTGKGRIYVHNGTMWTMIETPYALNDTCPRFAIVEE